MKERIKELRRVLELNQTEFAARLGYTQTTVSVWERGGKIPESSLQVICQTFHVRREWLERGEGEMFERSREANDDEAAQRRFVAETFAAMPDSKRRIILEALCDYLERNGDAIPATLSRALSPPSSAPTLTVNDNSGTVNQFNGGH